MFGPTCPLCGHQEAFCSCPGRNTLPMNLPPRPPARPQVGHTEGANADRSGLFGGAQKKPRCPRPACHPDDTLDQLTTSRGWRCYRCGAVVDAEGREVASAGDGRSGPRGAWKGPR